MKILTYILLLITATSFFFACSDDDKFSTNSNLRLTFSSDTIRFDTVFATIGTSTQRLKVYNRNDEALMISTVELINSGISGFKINVDGQSGNIVNNISILAKDSMYVFVEITVPPLDKNGAVRLSDSIRFQVNGINQYVSLEAIGQNAIIWNAKTIDKETTLDSESPYLIYDFLKIEKDVTLHIEKGTYLYFHKDAKLLIEGTIDAKGTIDEPIFFRGDRTDNLSANIPYSRVPGQWYGIEITGNSHNNNFENVRIENGIYGVKIEPSQPTQNTVSFYNTIIQNTTKEVIYAIDAQIRATNCLFANAGTYTLYLIGGKHNFLQCTIANYMTYPGVFRRGTMYLGEETNTPMQEANFINSIVSGSSSSRAEINIDLTENADYSFINCLLRVPSSNDNHFINTIWNENPGFKTIYSVGDSQRYYYSFELTENSKAIDKANVEYAIEVPFDIRGISRSFNGPDIGCYEWVAN